jgi:hypothetical protein
MLPDKSVSRRADTWANDIYVDMVQRGVFPRATEAGQHYFPVFRFLERNDEDKKQERLLFRFTFIDAPGEMYKDPVGYDEIWHTGNVYEYLSKCKGILILLDPTDRIEGRPDETFPSLFKTLDNLLTIQGTGRIDTPIAACLTKCDHPRCRAALKDERAFALSTFGAPLVGQLETFCRNLKWFASSALGFEDGRPMNVIRRWNGQMGIRNYRKAIISRRVEWPLTWLAEQLGLYTPPTGQTQGGDL